MDFDGTDDIILMWLIPINRGELGNNMSIEAFFRYDGTSGAGYRPIIGGNDRCWNEVFFGKNSGNSNFGVQDGNYSGSFVSN